MKNHPDDTQLYFSTNPWVKWYISRNFRNDVHYVWCSAYFDPENLAAEHKGSLIPATSSPKRIYQDLQGTQGRAFDTHNAKIVSQKASLNKLVADWLADGSIDDEAAAEIQHMLKASDYSIWRPLIYLIPCAVIDPVRVEKVPPQERAGFGEEYIIKDLKGHEFTSIRPDD